MDEQDKVVAKVVSTCQNDGKWSHDIAVYKCVGKATFCVTLVLIHK